MIESRKMIKLLSKSKKKKQQYELATNPVPFYIFEIVTNKENTIQSLTFERF